MTSRLSIAILVTFLISSAVAQTTASSVASAEYLYAVFNDATAAIATIDSGYAKTFGGRNLSEWKAMQSRSRKELQTQLSKIVETGLNSSDKRAVNLMKAAL